MDRMLLRQSLALKHTLGVSRTVSQVTEGRKARLMKGSSGESDDTAAADIELGCDQRIKTGGCAADLGGTVQEGGLKALPVRPIDKKVKRRV